MAASDGEGAQAQAGARKGYLETQRKRLTEELDASRVLAAEGDAELKQITPQLQQAVDEIAAAVRSVSQTATRSLLKGKRIRSIPEGLVLYGLVGSVKGMVAMWVVALLLAVYASFYLSAGQAALTTSGFLLVWLPMALLGTELAARRKVRGFTASARALGALVPSFVMFDEHESGDPRFPYHAAIGPVRDAKGVFLTPGVQNFTIDKKHGAQHGAAFVSFYDPANTGKTRLLSRLPAGVARQVMPFDAEAWAIHEAAWTTLLQALEPVAMTHLPLIRALADVQFRHNRHRAAVVALEKRLETLEGVEKNWADVALDMPVLDQVLKLVDSFASGRKPSPKGVLLYGPPGTGKTLIARKLAKHAGCEFKAITISDLKADFTGGTGLKVKAVWNECRAKAPCILFIDECESAFAKRGGANSDSFNEELVQTFLAEWDGFNESSGQVLVVGATNQNDRLDNAIMSRFTASILIPPPNAVGRRRILGNELGKARLGLAVSDTMVQETSGMSGRELHTLVAGLLAEHIGGKVTEADFLVESRKLRGKSSTSIESKAGWDDIVLPEATRQEFQSLGKELRHAEELAAMNISVPTGILLYGPPGTGKTQLARVLANESGLSFIAKSSGELKANFIGQSGSRVRELFEQARGMAPCLLFLDEIDSVTPARGSGGDSFAADIVAQLLQELDGVKSSSAGKVFLLAASNHPDLIDPALLSRLGRRIEIGLPDAAGREAILRLQLAGKPLDFDAGDMARELAARTEGKSGRDLGTLVTAATRKAVQRALRDEGDPTRLRVQKQDFDGIELA